MQIDDDDWHELKDRLFILKKRVGEHIEEREDMVKLLQYFCDHTNSVQKMRVITKRFLREIGELD